MQGTILLNDIDVSESFAYQHNLLRKSTLAISNIKPVSIGIEGWKQNLRMSASTELICLTLGQRALDLFGS